MNVEIDLYRTDDYVQAGRMPIRPLLNAVFEPVLGDRLAACRFRLTFLALADHEPLDGRPEVTNLRAGCGYVVVRIVHGEQVVYRHPHPVREVIARPLQKTLAERFPDETHWGFGVSGPGLDRFALVRPAPKPDNEIELGADDARRAVFHIEELPDAEPAASSLVRLGVADADGAQAGPPDGPVVVVVGARPFEALTRGAALSDEVEEGGFLVGRVFLDEARPERRIVEVSDAVSAQRTGASLLHFTFTGESFLRISEQLAQRGRGERLVGWYHTHLFPATDRLGLSSIDVDLHRGTFRLPWQIAGLVNLDGDARVLRFYRVADDGVEPATYWVADHDGR